MLINNHQLHIETYGPVEGKPVVFLHHGLGSTLAWRRQIPDFTAAGYRLILYDRWGYGQSDARPYLAVPGFEDDLDDLSLLLDTLETGLITLIGHSDGGSIALYFAALFPERVHALVTVAAHIYLESKMEPGIHKIRQAFEQDSRFRQGLARVHGEKYESTFNNWFNGWHHPGALTWDMRPLLVRINCPTLVIQGEADEHATAQHARDIAHHIPGAVLWLAPGIQHMLPQEIAKEFSHKVIEFLRSVEEDVGVRET